MSVMCIFLSLMLIQTFTENHNYLLTSKLM